MRTARSRLCNNQKPQLASHLLPSLKAVGMTAFVKMSLRTGPSSLCSTTRAIATASWKSERFLTQTLTASFRLPPSRKNAAAYSTSNVRCQNYGLRISMRTHRISVYSKEQRHFSVLQCANGLARSRYSRI